MTMTAASRETFAPAPGGRALRSVSTLAYGAQQLSMLVPAALGQRVVRMLGGVREAHPELELHGLDLSPYYVQEARATLSAVPDVSLVADNAEAMPFADGLFDVITSVYLFHELPRSARHRVFREMLRVLRPGGLLVIEDSAQLSESSEIGYFLQRFPEDFHEPFFRDYVSDDLREGLEEVGFEVTAAAPCFVSKVVTARRPLA